MSVTGGSASSKYDAAQAGRSGRLDRPTQAPRSETAHGPDPISIPPLPATAVKLAKFGPLIAVERRLEERRGRRGHAVDLGLFVAEVVEKHGQQECPGVVVRAVTFLEVWDGVRGVLEDPGGIGHPLEMVESPGGELGLLLGERPHRQGLVGLILSAEAGLLKRLLVMVGRPLPDHLPPEPVRGLTHGKPARHVVTRTENLPRRPAGSANGTITPCPGEQFLRVPVRRRDDRHAAAERRYARVPR